MSKKITTESEFYQELKKRTEGHIFYERIEPKTEGGFPDVHFVLRNLRGMEGTLELKVHKTKSPNLMTLMRGSQKAGILDYYQGGGSRRFVASYDLRQEMIFLYSTAEAVASLLGKDSSRTLVALHRNNLGVVFRNILLDYLST